MTDTRRSTPRPSGLVLAGVGLGISLLLLMPGWQEWQLQQDVVAARRLELQRLQAAPVVPDSANRIALPNTADEASLFLGEMRALAQATRSQLVGLDVRPRGGTPESKASDAVQPVRTQLSLRSTYPRLRQFLARLADADRLYVVTDLSLRGRAAAGGDAPTLDATLVVERYLLMDGSQPGAGAGSSP